VSRAHVLFLVLAVGLVAGCDDDSGSPTAPGSAAPSVLPVPPPAPPTPPPGPPPTAPVSLKVKITPNPPKGAPPLDVNANLCQSRPTPPVDDYPLTFTFDYGDGVLRVQTFCRNHHIYQAAGSFDARFCATDGIAGHESCKDFRVQVQ
jgi:hypothetical protein